MHWTYDEYLDQPLWFINELVEELNREARQRDKDLMRTRNG